MRAVAKQKARVSPRRLLAELDAAAQHMAHSLGEVQWFNGYRAGKGERATTGATNESESPDEKCRRMWREADEAKAAFDRTARRVVRTLRRRSSPSTKEGR